MTRPGLLYKDIVDSIENLIKNGSKITINNIRENIGRGSPTTISKFLKKWRTTKDTESILKNSIEISTSKNIGTNNTTHSEVKKMSPNLQNEKKETSESDSIVVNTLLEISENINDVFWNTHLDEWESFLNEKNSDIKIKKLCSALMKEQMRRKTADKIAKESKMYAEAIKEQIQYRLSDLKNSLEDKIRFLSDRIIDLKKESRENLDNYRKRLDKANLTILSLSKKYPNNRK